MLFLFAFADVDGYVATTYGTFTVASVVDVVYGNVADAISIVAVAFDIFVYIRYIRLYSKKRTVRTVRIK